MPLPETKNKINTEIQQRRAEKSTYNYSTPSSNTQIHALGKTHCETEVSSSGILKL